MSDDYLLAIILVILTTPLIGLFAWFLIDDHVTGKLMVQRRIEYEQRVLKECNGDKNAAKHRIAIVDHAVNQSFQNAWSYMKNKGRVR